MAGQRSKGWIAWFAYNPVAANLLMAVLLIVGGATGFNLRTEGVPAEEPRNVTVSVSFPGASPEDVEEGAAIKVEDALDGVAGIQKITSTVTEEGVTSIVRSKEGYPIDTLKDDIQARVDAISTFPTRVESTIVTKEQDDSHVIFVQVYGDADHATLKEAARRVREQILDLSGVNKIITEGARTSAINVEIQNEKLRAYDLTFAEVATALQNSSLTLSAGSLKTEGGAITLQSRQQRYYGSEFADIVIRSSAEGGIVRVRDIAHVNDGFTEQAVLSTFQGQPSINLGVQLVGSSSITDVSSSVQRVVAEIRQQSWLPENIHIATWYDEADTIRDRLGLLSKNALVGMGLVLIVLAIFLNVRVAFWVACGIPVSFAGALLVMGPGFFNYSLNDLTTFAFIIVLGIVVDDAIVIGENIFTHKKRDGGDVETTIRGVREVAIPATFGVLTTIAAFYPLTMITGEFGGPFRMIAVVTVTCLLFSLIESKLILPAHLAQVNFTQEEKKCRGRLVRLWTGFQERVEATLQYVITSHYKPVVQAAVSYRYQSLGVFVAILILAGGLIESGAVRTVFFADWDTDIIYAEVVMSPGTPAHRTHQVAQNLENSLQAANDEIRRQYSMDSDPVAYSYTYSGSDKTASMTVQLAPGKTRQFSGNELVTLWREKTGFENDVRQLDFYAGTGGEDDLEFQMSSADKNALQQAMISLKRQIAKYEGVHDIRTNLDNNRLELAIEIRPEGKALGLTYRDVTDQLRHAVFGFEVQRVQRSGEEIRVMVRYPRSERDNVSDLESFRIRTKDGGTVPLFIVADLSQSRKQTQIDRVDGRRVLELSARVNKDIVSPALITEVLEDEIIPAITAQYPGVDIHVGGEAEAEEDAIDKLIWGFVLGLLIIYALLAVPLKSYTEPFVIMLAIPFGVIGAIIGHMIIDIPVSLLSFFGVLALSGVVVNDSLVLVSRYNQIRKTGMDYRTAVVTAGMSRFRAILLTSITTFVGLFPLILEKSEQAQLLIPMAVSLAFGILFSTFITLLIVPVLLGVRLDIINSIRALRD